MAEALFEERMAKTISESMKEADPQVPGAQEIIDGSPAGGWGKPGTARHRSCAGAGVAGTSLEQSERGALWTSGRRGGGTGGRVIADWHWDDEAGGGLAGRGGALSWSTGGWPGGAVLG